MPCCRLPQFAAFALLASTGCTALTFQAPRPIFPADVKIQTVCIEYPSTVESVSAGMATAAAAGWRVMTLGVRTTSFLIFGTEHVVVCYEKHIGAATDDASETALVPVQPSVAQGQQPRQAGNAADTRSNLARACSSGEFRGCYNLGVLEHQSGNLAEAKRLFAKACDGGDMGGCNNLGLLERQSGNLVAAKSLYVKACAGNDMRACTNLGALEKQAGNLAEARRLFTQACNSGEEAACNGLKALERKAQSR